MQTTILLDAAASENTGSTMNIIFIVAIFVIFYFFMIRPQNKKRKQLKMK